MILVTLSSKNELCSILVMNLRWTRTQKLVARLSFIMSTKWVMDASPIRKIMMMDGLRVYDVTMKNYRSIRDFRLVGMASDNPSFHETLHRHEEIRGMSYTIGVGLPIMKSWQQLPRLISRVSESLLPRCRT
jgi:hypothetical protein